MVIGVAAAEVAVALLLAWLLTRSGVPRHASQSAGLGLADALILVALLACLGLFVFVLAFWQWRLRGRDRVRVLLASHLSLTMAFLGLCWYDVSVRTGELSGGPGGGTTLERVIEQTMASGLTLASLLAGLSALAAILWLARRALNATTPDGIVVEGSGNSSCVRGTAK
ncbi:MAG TPA: hypothetical protein VNE39_04725 [Planctomycetota bacterium]|nr:hypothetical protein [Planctomycetota bacterium]